MIHSNIMLQRTFRIFDGIGEKTEQNLWKAGYETWDSVIRGKNNGAVSDNLWNRLLQEIPPIQKALRNNNPLQLRKYVDSATEWRAVPDYIGHIAYLDIETTGLYYPRDKITTIAVYDGKKVFNFVRGKNLDDFEEFILKFSAVATYYGKCFDVPFIEQELGFQMPHFHFDLCFILRKLGLTGGLKGVERKLGISRGDMKELDGYTAVLMWKQYKKTNEQRYLDTLLAYNNEDVINLEYLLYYAYNNLIKTKKLPFSKLNFPNKDVFRPYKADIYVIREFQRYSN